MLVAPVTNIRYAVTTRDGQDDIDGYHNVKMEGGWCRLCELEESYIKDVQSLPPCQTS